MVPVLQVPQHRCILFQLSDAYRLYGSCSEVLLGVVEAFRVLLEGCVQDQGYILYFMRVWCCCMDIGQCVTVHSLAIHMAAYAVFCAGQLR